ncbi:LexA family transcriptional regulator [Paracidovorax avenae]|uniref:LexA family transcriptional regulator n=1 Tax=Paracidovorax avenae TaxID=80867 RepID=UPI001864E976|nr:helix-turn-helix transcriptional regulator [Paracidovorax avenae]
MQQLASALGVSYQAVAKVRDGGAFGTRNNLKAAELLGVRPEWLATGKGDKHPESPQAGVSPPPVINLENNPDYPAVRRVAFKLSAGASGFGIEYHDEEGAPIVFQRQWYEGRGLRPEKLFAVRVGNNSMQPGLHDGDTVIVNTEVDTPKDGVVFAINYEGELVIKRLMRDGGQWWLTSDNPDQTRYPRKVCHEGVKLVGEIVHKQSERI